MTLTPRIVLLLVVAGLLPEAVLADIPEDNLLDQVVTQYRASAGAWSGTIANAAMWVFWTLVTIEIVWTGVTLVLRDADLGEVLAEITNRVIIIGFFSMLLMLGPQWAQDIVRSLGQLAGQASVAGGGLGSVTPGAVFDSGLELADRMTSAVSFWDSATDALGLLIASIIIMIVFAIIAAFLVMTMVEVWVVINAGIILLGFGGSRFTKDFALKYLIYAVSVGMKFFIMLLMIGIGQSFINSWVANWANQDSQVLLAIGASIVLLALVREIPNIMQGLMSGMSFATGDTLVRSGANGMRAAVAGGAALAGAAAGLAGGAAAIKQALSLAKTQGATGVGGVARQAMANLASAAAGEAGERMRRGHFAGPKSGAGYRMQDALKAAQAELKADKNSIEKG